MQILKETKTTESVRMSVSVDGKEVAHAYLYLFWNDAHTEPIGYMEDVFVDETCRGSGIGTKLLHDLIAEARARGCYKLIGTSRKERERVHALYKRLGFAEWGKEFRMDFE